MQPGLHRSDLRPSDAGDFLERKILNEMQKQHRPMRHGQLIEQLHELSLLFFADEHFLWSEPGIGEIVVLRIDGNLFRMLFAPMLDALLVSDVEEPGTELFVALKARNVPRGVDERLLDDIETRLFLMDQLVNIGVKRQAKAGEQDAPGLRFPGPGFPHGQLFVFGHYQHLHAIECTAEKKVQFLRYQREQLPNSASSVLLGRSRMLSCQRIGPPAMMGCGR